MNSAPIESSDPSRVLIVEDEAIVAEEIHDRLTKLKFNVVGIEDNGSKAIKAAEREHPDLILMDIRLKGILDGIDTAAEIRKRLNVPIVYMSAHSDAATVKRAKATAPYGYILKPVHERELEIAVDFAIHRHSLERRLRESELRHSAVLSSIGDGVISTDREGRITFMNRVAEALTGWPVSDVYLMPADRVLRLVDEKSRRAVENPVEVALRLGTATKLVRPMLLLARDGSVIPIDDSAAPIIDSDGNMLGVVVAFHDIRDRRLAEDALRKAEDELRQAQKLESIGQLAGGVAHDFNNFLTAINGYCELLLRSGTLAEPNENMVRQIQKAGDRSAQLTSQLLAFSRQQMLNPRVLNVNSLITGAERLLQRVIGEHIQIVLDLAANLPNVKADPIQIEQIIINLSVNARDAMPEGGQLTIDTGGFELDDSNRSMKPMMPVGKYVMIAVSDTGVGMDEATIGRVFEPFFTTKELGKGTGLGLATVYGIVRQSGGHVCVHSEVGIGSEFKVYLPAVSDAETTVHSNESDFAPTGSETILLVEDDDAVRQVAASVLREFGYTVLTAHNGAQAIELKESFGDTIDVLVTDTVLPGISGPQLAKQLLESSPDMPVVFISGYTDRALEEAMLAYPRAKFLQKPFTLAALARRIRELIDTKK